MSRQIILDASAPRVARTCARWLFLLSGLLLLLAGCGSPSSGPEVRKRGDTPITGAPDEGKWQEEGVQLPPYPQDKNLISFKISGPATPTRFYVDGSSLSVGSDKVIRFALVIRTSEDATTVSYTGLRCATGEWKDYAFGRSNRTWVVDDNAKWQRIRPVDYNDFQETLMKDYFCYGGVTGGGVMGDAKTLVARLKYTPMRDPRIPNKELTQ
jgi:hypothetical protein